MGTGCSVVAILSVFKLDTVIGVGDAVPARGGMQLSAADPVFRLLFGTVP